MLTQHTTTTDFYSRYKFNGKELDKETGYYYYGARYYEPSVSQWLSVDPLVEKYPAYSPYNYTLDNPVMLVDPDGKGPEYDWIIFSNGDTAKVGPKGGDNVDYITKVNEDGSIHQIVQAGGKLHESSFFMAKGLPPKYRNNEDYDVAVSENLITATTDFGDFTLSSSQKIIDNPHSKGTINLNSENILSSVTYDGPLNQSTTVGNGTLKQTSFDNTTVGFDAKTDQIIMGRSTPRFNGQKFSLEVKMNARQAANTAVLIIIAIETKGKSLTNPVPLLKKTIRNPVPLLKKIPKFSL